MHCWIRRVRERTFIARLRCRPVTGRVRLPLRSSAARRTAIVFPVYDLQTVAFPFSRRLRAGGLFLGEVALSALAELFGTGGNPAWKSLRRFSIDVERAKLSKNPACAKTGYNALRGSLIPLPTRHPGGTVGPEKRDSLRNLARPALPPSSLLSVLGDGREVGRTLGRAAQLANLRIPFPHGGRWFQFLPHRFAFRLPAPSGRPRGRDATAYNPPGPLPAQMNCPARQRDKATAKAPRGHARISLHETVRQGPGRQAAKSNHKATRAIQSAGSLPDRSGYFMVTF